VHENAPIHYVQAQLGHHSPDFTQRVYGHLLSRDRGRYADRLDDGVVVTEVRDEARAVTG
jgi:integrase